MKKLGLKIKIRVPGNEDLSARRWWALALWVLFFVLSCYCTLGVDFLGQPLEWTKNNILPWEYYPFWVIAILAYIGCMCLYPPKLKKRTIQIVSTLMVVWMIFEAVRVFTVPTTPFAITLPRPINGAGTVTKVYAAKLSDLMMDFSDEVLWVLLLFSIFTLSRPLIGRIGIKIFLWFAIAVCLVCIFYTYAPSQIDAYHQVIDFFTGVSPNLPDIKGFFPEKNSFAFALFIGLLSTMMLNADHPRAWLYVPLMLYFGVTIMLSGCKTLMAILVVFTPIYMIWRLAITYSAHPVRNSLTIGVCVLGLAALGVLFATQGHIEGTFFNRVLNGLQGLIHQGSQTMNSRWNIWQTAMTVYSYSPFRMIFGWGYRAGEQLSMQFQSIWSFETQRSTHSGMLDILLRWGAIGGIGFIGMLALTTHEYLDLSRSGRTGLAVEMAIVMALLIIYSVDESKMPFYRDTTSLILLVVSVCPAMAFNDGGKDIEEVLI